VTSTRTTLPATATDTVTAPPGTAEPLCRTELVTSSLAITSTASASGPEAPSTLATKARATRTCAGTAGIVTLSGTAGTSAADIKDTDPPRPAPARPWCRAARRRAQDGCTLDSARRVKPQPAPSAAPGRSHVTWS
jgi:hypothetical protein